MIDFVSQHCESSEVYLSSQKTFAIDNRDIKELINLANNNIRQRVRYCSHASSQESVHEMFIVHPKGAYVRPHKHFKKAESMMIIDGEVDYIIFDDNGNVKEIISMGNYQSGKHFYQSTRTELYHTLLIRSEWLVFLEITKGPFVKKDTAFAEWSPKDEDSQAVKKFIDVLKEFCL